MAYDEELAQRIRKSLAGKRNIEEKKMFGGIAFMHRGNMFIGVQKDELMVRVGKDQHEEAVSRPHARVMDFTKKPMVGYVYVKPAGFSKDADLKSWIDMAMNFSSTLPKK